MASIDEPLSPLPPRSGASSTGEPVKDQNLFWKPNMVQSDERLDYTLNEEVYMIQGDVYAGFINIWKRRLNSQKHIQDDEVVKILRLSHMSDEALGEVWQEASLASYLEINSKDSDEEASNEEDSDCMEWRELLILLDVSYRRSGSDLKSFLARFELPSVRKTKLRHKSNPFQSQPKPECTGLEDAPLQTNLNPSPAPSCTESSVLVAESNEITSTHPNIPSRLRYEHGSQQISPAARLINDSQDANRWSSAISMSSLKNQHDTQGQIQTPEIEVPNPTITADLEVVETSNAPELRTSLENLSKVEFEAGLEVVRPPSQPTGEIDRDEKLFSEPTDFHQQKHEVISPINKPYDGAPQSGTPELEVPLCTPEMKLIARNRLTGLQANEAIEHTSSGIKGSMKRLQKLGSRKPEEGKFSLATLATALEQAAEEDSVALAEAFLGFGGDPNFRVTGRKAARHRALEIAAAKNHTHFVDFLILHGADRIAVNNALVHCTVAGHVNLSRRLIVTHKADVNASAYLHNFQSKKLPESIVARMAYLNVLSSASCILNVEQRVDFVHFLISKGCDVNALQWLVSRETTRNKKKRFGKEHVDHGFGYSTVGLFVDRVCYESIQLLLKVGAMLHLTPQKPLKSVMDGLREHSFDCETFSIVQPISCLTVECWRSATLFPKVVDLLLQHGSDISLNEINGMWELPQVCSHEGHNTPLTRAIEGGSVEGVKYLLDKGLSPNSIARESGYRNTQLLHLACTVGEIDVVKVLVKRGANLTGRVGSYGETAMMAATRRGRLDIIECLLKAGGNKDDGSLGVAVKELNIDIVDSLLFKHGASPQAALDSALEFGIGTKSEKLKVFVRIMKRIIRAHEELGLQLSADVLERAIKRSSVAALRVIYRQLDPQIHQAINVAPQHNQEYKSMSPRPSGYWSQTFQYSWTHWDTWNFDRDNGDKIDLTPFQLALMSSASKEMVDLLASWGADTSRIIRFPRDFSELSSFKEALKTFTKVGITLQTPHGLEMRLRK